MDVQARATYRIETFGGLVVAGGTAPLTGAATQRKTMLLLAVLAAAGPQGISREKLLGLFWPDSDTDRARHALKQAIHILRRDLRDSDVIVGTPTLRLNPDVIASDVGEFDEALARGDLGRAAALYRGPFLDGLYLDGAPEFERWLERERTRLAHAHAAAVEKLAVAVAASGDHARAVGWWRRLAAGDPLSSRIALGLMKALVAAGEPEAALQHARVHEALVRQELEAPPDPAVSALAARLREGMRARATTAPAQEPPRAASAARSVAVLPFVNMSDDPSNAYFSDGLSEELITVLSHIEGLRVAARTSSFALRDAHLDVRAIGDTLGVASVVEGSVRREGDRLRVTAQLVDARSGWQLWSGEYDRQARDVFSVQDEIAQAIAGALRLTLVGGASASSRTADPEAHDLYLHGTYFRSKLSRDAIATAIGYFDRAIARDAAYALAYAGKATAIGPLLYFAPLPREPRLSAMRAAAQRALALDERIGEAHVAMGTIHLFFEWDWPAAERALRRATSLNPRDPHAWHVFANWLRIMGRLDEAIVARRRALVLDPLNPRTAITLGVDYMCTGRYDLALEQYRRALDIDPANPLFLGLGPNLAVGPGEVFEAQGRSDTAGEEYLRVAARRDATAEELAALRRGYAENGMPGFWRGWLRFEERDAGGTPRAIRMAAIHARIGDPAQAAAWLERAWAERDPGMIFLGVDYDWRAVRDDPRITAIRRRMHLPG